MKGMRPQASCPSISSFALQSFHPANFRSDALRFERLGAQQERRLTEVDFLQSCSLASAQFTPDSSILGKSFVFILWRHPQSQRHLINSHHFC